MYPRARPQWAVHCALLFGVAALLGHILGVPLKDPSGAAWGRATPAPPPKYAVEVPADGRHQWVAQLDAAADADAAHRGARGDAEARAATLLAAKLGFMLADSADEGARPGLELEIT